MVLEELADPSTGRASDADPLHRHPVRLTEVRREVDPLGDVPVVEIRWAHEDALPFTLTVCTVGPPPACEALEDLAVARGNIVLVDHGETVRQKDQPKLHDGARTFLTVPFDPPDDLVPSADIDWCCVDVDHTEAAPLEAGRYAPRLGRRPLVFSVPIRSRPRPASETLQQDPRSAHAQVALFSPAVRQVPWTDVLTPELKADETMLYERWVPRRDLLESDAGDRHFVVEVEDDGQARIRFGDGSLGVRPMPDTRYLVWYRVGGGRSGNVGRDSIRCLLLRGSIEGGGRVTSVRNPLQARGGTAPEPVADVRLRAPNEIRTRLARAVTADDYAALALREFPTRIQRAAAELAPTPANRTKVSLFIDPVGTTSDDADLRARIEDRLRPFVRIGHRLEVRLAEYVPIDLTLRVRPLPHHRWEAVAGALRYRFGSGVGPDGKRGFFHPDRITFGQSVIVSAIIAAAREVAGVGTVEVVNLTVHAGPPGVPLDEVFSVGQPWRIARLDNDPRRPANGVLTIEEVRT
ncbi:MAG TPA: putative baseplate assembly protein [Arachnia sp.]|nr:putative baseplate assembly protein [Arachnia sp.]